METKLQIFMAMEVLSEVQMARKDIPMIHDLRVEIDRIINSLMKPVLTEAESNLIEQYFQLDWKLIAFIHQENGTRFWYIPIQSQN